MAIKQASRSSISTGSKTSTFWDQESAEGDLVPIASFYATSVSTSSVGFTNIPQDFRDLYVTYQVAASGNTTIGWRPNNISTGSLYSYTMALYSPQSNPTAAQTPRATGENLANASGYHQFVLNSTVTPYFFTAYTHINSYSNPNVFKTLFTRYGQNANGVEANEEIGFTVNLLRDTSAITSLYLVASTGANFAIGTTVSLYGIRG